MDNDPYGSGIVKGEMHVGRALLAEDIFSLRFLSDPVIAPDGTRIAFAVTELDPAANSYRSGLWLYAGGRDAVLTKGPWRDTRPQWSPDGQFLAFVSTRGSNGRQVWVLPAGGDTPWALTSFAGGVVDFAWSPDSRRLVVVAREAPEESGQPGGAAETVKNGVDMRPSTARRITNLRYKFDGHGFFDPAHRPELFLLSLDGGRNGTRPPEKLAWVTACAGDDQEAVLQEARFSPDGKRLAVTFMTSGEETHRIYIADLDGHSLSPACEGSFSQWAGVFSPDGKKLAFFAEDRPDGRAPKAWLAVVDLDTHQVRNVLEGFDRSVGNHVRSDARIGSTVVPEWSRDGEYVYFLASDRGATHVYRAAVTGPGAVEQLTVDAREVVSGYSVGPDGRIAYAKAGPLHPEELWLQDANGSPRRLLSLNEAVLSSWNLVEPVPFTVESKDGLPIDGWLMAPPGVERPWPGILQIHGGPHGAYGWSFFFQFQYLCSHGYAIFYTNPRGSESYGHDFASGCVGDWGGGDFQDIMAGVDKAIALGVDPQRLGVMGLSYGGYMTNWIITHSDRFAAAVTEGSISNLYSMYGTADIGYFFNRAENGGTPWENEERLLERSPMRYVANAHGAVLIIHNENDLRCPMEQAEQFYVALKQLGLTTEFVRYAGESHTMYSTGRPWNRVDRLERIAAWFDRHLAGEKDRAS